MESHPFKDTVGEALMSKDVSPESLENMVKVLLLGGVEKTKGENDNGRDQNDLEKLYYITPRLDNSNY